MYVKIENNILKAWANWNFDGSTKVDIDYDYYNANKDSFKIMNNQLMDISTSEEYQKKIRLNAIEKDLISCDTLFTLESQKPIIFENHLYKFEWTSLYQNLLSLNESAFPMKIWDITELEANAVLMTKSKLQELQNLLIRYQEEAFQERKTDRARLIQEKNTLEENIN